MSRWLVAILMAASVLLHVVCGGRCGSGVTVCGAERCGGGAIHEHSLHDDPHLCEHWSGGDGCGDAGMHEDDSSRPGHIHLCAGDDDSPRPGGPTTPPRIAPVVVAVLDADDVAGAGLPVQIRRSLTERRSAGPPERLRTVRLLI